MKLTFLLTIFALLIFAPVSALAQELPSTYSFERKPADNGSVTYSLMQNVRLIAEKNGLSKPSRSLGVVANKTTNVVFLMFVTVQNKPLLARQKAKTAIIALDSEKITGIEFFFTEGRKHPTLSVEEAYLGMTFDQLEKILKSKSVTLQIGAVIYKLDSDNLAALSYLASEIKKDSTQSK